MVRLFSDVDFFLPSEINSYINIVKYSVLPIHFNQLAIPWMISNLCKQLSVTWSLKLLTLKKNRKLETWT